MIHDAINKDLNPKLIRHHKNTHGVFLYSV